MSEFALFHCKYLLQASQITLSDRPVASFAGQGANVGGERATEASRDLAWRRCLVSSAMNPQSLTSRSTFEGRPPTKNQARVSSIEPLSQCLPASGGNRLCFQNNLVRCRRLYLHCDIAVGSPRCSWPLKDRISQHLLCSNKVPLPAYRISDRHAGLLAGVWLTKLLCFHFIDRFVALVLGKLQHNHRTTWRRRTRSSLLA